MTPDPELLRQFAQTNSEDAFAELVKRHVNLVHSAALRQVNGDEHLAKDVAQMVFTDLARKANSLSRRESLTGWLYTSAHFAAAKIVRGENRRRDREEKFMRDPTSETGPETDWQRIRPALDDAMHELKESDRDAILLRYFENRQFAEVGAKLGLNENAARMRVERALEKLRAIFAKRGIATASAIASAISANAVQIAPAGLATTLTTVSIATAGTGTFALLKIMTMTKLKLAVSAIVVASAATAFVVQNQAQEKLRVKNGELTQQLTQLQADNEDLSNRLAIADNSKSLSDEQFTELLRLRGEVGVLKSQLAKTTNLTRVEVRSASLNQSNSDSFTQQRQMQMHKLNNAKVLVAAAMFGYAQHHQNQFPTNWDQIKGYFDEWERNGLNPGDAMPDTTADFNEATNQFEFAYQGSLSNLQNSTNYQDTIVLREKQAWQIQNGKWVKVYGYADGHSQVLTEPIQGFDVYEQLHMVSPPNQ
jgi:RNA polymerase sigma factor (sigma-70 family)